MKNVQPSSSKASRKKPIRTLYSKPVLLGLLVIIVLLARASWGIYLKDQESRKNVAMVKTELEGLKERKEVLQKETDKLNTEEGIEEAIREKFQVSKEGESVLVVVDKPLPASKDDEERNFFNKVWESVTGIFDKKVEE